MSGSKCSKDSQEINGLVSGLVSSVLGLNKIELGEEDYNNNKSDLMHDRIFNEDNKYCLSEIKESLNAKKTVLETMSPSSEEISILKSSIELYESYGKSITDLGVSGLDNLHGRSNHITETVKSIGNNIGTNCGIISPTFAPACIMSELAAKVKVRSQELDVEVKKLKELEDTVLIELLEDVQIQLNLMSDDHGDNYGHAVDEL